MKKALAVFFGGLGFAAAVTLVSAHAPKHELASQPAAAAGQSAYAQAGDANAAAMPVVVFAPSLRQQPAHHPCAAGPRAQPGECQRQ